MEKIFKPQKVAIVGASATAGKIGNILIKNIKSKVQSPKSKVNPTLLSHFAKVTRDKKLRGTGTGGVKIFPVNPKGGEIDGLTVYKSLADIKEKIDLAVIAVPAKFVNQVIQEGASKEESVSNFIIIAAGFGEAGPEGIARKEEMQKLIKEYNLNILGPNCLGVINATENINLSFAKKEVAVGKIGLISQSGAFITAMIDIAEKEQFGFSLIASLGNKIDINEVELLDYYNQDPNTKIIALYLESISQGKEFQKKLTEVKKPVIIIKAGNTTRTQQAIQSHTGSMAGESAVIEEVIKDSGAIQVDNLEDFVTILQIFNNFKTTSSGQNLVIVTNAGGPGVITTDLIENSKLALREFTKEEKRELKNLLPKESSVNNPIDLLGDALEDRYDSILQKLQTMPRVDGVLALITPQSQTPIKEITEVIIKANQESAFPIFPIVIGGEAERSASKICRQAGFNSFTFPVMVTRALNLMTPKLAQKNKDNSKDKENLQSSKTMGKLLSYQDTIQIALKYNLNILGAEYPNTSRELEEAVKKIGLPVVMKVDSPNIIHKNAHNGVVVGLETLAEAQIEFSRFQKDFPGEKVLVQHQVSSGLEIILGLKRDESFGLVLVIGLGGIITEILDEKILFVNEVSEAQIRFKLENSKLLKILQKEKISENDLIDQALRLFKLGQENTDIKEIDINPMFFYKNKQPVIVDFKIIK